MMKRFEKMGKIAGLMLLGLAFVFAGCQGMDESSSSSGGGAVAIAPQGVQITVDPANEALLIENGEVGISEATTVGGATIVDLKNDGACTGGAGGELDCWLKLTNLHPTMALTNVFINHSGCINCTTAQLSNADFCGAPGNTCKDVNQVDVPTAPNGSGYCFVENGQYVPITRKPFNTMGCDLQNCPASSQKPYQIIHPECGQKSILYDFSSQTELYTFYGNIDATLVPWNPVGANGAPGGGDDDARYDFQNYTTIYLMLADFGHKTGYSTQYARGAWKRSNILAGYGAPGNASGMTVASPGGGVATDAYFSVNVGIEYPDRIESQAMGSPAAFNAATGYEYYGTYAVFFRFDRNVVRPVAVNKAASGIYSGVRLPCWTQGNCDLAGRQSYQHLQTFNLSLMGNINSAEGYIYFYRQIGTNFNYYSSLKAYATDAGGVINVGTFNNKEGGHNGVAIWDRAFLGGTIVAGSYLTAGGRTQQGPDAAPEQNLLNFHFWTLAGTSGKSTPIKVDSFAGFTTFILGHTGLDFYPSGKDEPTDWAAYCAPYSAGFADPANQHCNPAKTQSDYTVYHGIENLKTGMPELLGEATTPGDGGPQNWSVYVCVQ